MTITRYGAKVEVIGAKYSHQGVLIAKAKLLELYDDGSGRIGSLLELPYHYFESDTSITEIVLACEKFVTLKEKELIMTTTIKNSNEKTLQQITDEYNALPGVKKVKKFRDKETAIARLAEAAGGVKAPKKEQAAKAPLVKKEATKKTSPDSSEKTGMKLVGKKSALAGKYLYKLTETNPRREGTHGWHSWNVLKNGMTYEQFIAAKGGNKHLMWDIAAGHVEARSKPKEAK